MVFNILLACITANCETLDAKSSLDKLNRKTFFFCTLQRGKVEHFIQECCSFEASTIKIELFMYLKFDETRYLLDPSIFEFET